MFKKFISSILGLVFIICVGFGGLQAKDFNSYTKQDLYNYLLKLNVLTTDELASTTMKYEDVDGQQAVTTETIKYSKARNAVLVNENVSGKKSSEYTVINKAICKTYIYNGTTKKYQLDPNAAKARYFCLLATNNDTLKSIVNNAFSYTQGGLAYISANYTNSLPKELTHDPYGDGKISEASVKITIKNNRIIAISLEEQLLRNTDPKCYTITINTTIKYAKQYLGVLPGVPAATQPAKVTKSSSVKKSTAKTTTKTAAKTTAKTSTTKYPDVKTEYKESPESWFYFTAKTQTIEYLNVKNCPKTLVIPAKIKGIPVKKINYSAFSDTKNVQTIVISYGITTVGPCAFSSDSDLVTVVIPRSVTSLDKYAFLNCGKLRYIVTSKGSFVDNHRDYLPKGVIVVIK